MNRFILFLIRIKLGVRKNQRFKFANQKDKRNQYFITSKNVKKQWFDGVITNSNVSLNYLISKKCEVIISE